MPVLLKCGGTSPYASRIPGRAKCALRAWNVVEQNELICTWYDPAGAEPAWELPFVPEMNTRDGWTHWYVREGIIKTQGKEVIENMADSAHFRYVHGCDISSFNLSFDRHTATQVTTVKHPTLGKVLKTSGTYYGPAIQFVDMEGDYPSRQVNCHTPIDTESIRLWYGVKMNMDVSDEETDSAARRYAAAAHDSFFEDVNIWENKVYRVDPILCDGDGPLHKLRKWYASL